MGASVQLRNDYYKEMVRLHEWVLDGPRWCVNCGALDDGQIIRRAGNSKPEDSCGYPIIKEMNTKG